MNMNIDYHILSHAISYYKSRGYEYMEVPWFVPSEINAVTKPEGVYGFNLDAEIFKGELVGSGEQSFIHLMNEGLLPPGKYMCVTPCFRDEPDGYDDLHQPYFMKVELINTNELLYEDLEETVCDCVVFFEKYVGCEVTETSHNAFDIVSYKNRVELGSYGIRSWGKFKWLYATGVALPRLSTAIKLEEYFEQSK